MLNKITWSSFAVLLALILTVYYLYVLIVYYRKEIFSFGAINRKSLTGNNLKTVLLKSDNIQKEKSTIETGKSGDESFTVIHELLEDLKELFLHASETKMIREELIQAIRSKLKTYPLIGETDLIDDINNHLIQEAKDKCGLELYPEDLKLIWDA
jgi:hypothetical protein